MERNCNNCWWSKRDVETLLLHCHIIEHHPATIDNTYNIAKQCNSYTPATEPPKEKYRQLTLF